MKELFPICGSKSRWKWLTGCRSLGLVGVSVLRLAYLRCSFLKLLQPPLVNPTTLEDEVASSGGLATVNVADNYHVNVSLLLSHGQVGGFAEQWRKFQACRETAVLAGASFSSKWIRFTPTQGLYELHLKTTLMTGVSGTHVKLVTDV